VKIKQIRKKCCSAIWWYWVWSWMHNWRR